MVPSGKSSLHNSRWFVRLVWERHELTERGNFDENGVEAGGDHVGQQRVLVAAPQVGQGRQAQTQTPAEGRQHGT